MFKAGDIYSNYYDVESSLLFNMCIIGGKSER